MKALNSTVQPAEDTIRWMKGEWNSGNAAAILSVIVYVSLCVFGVK